MLTSGLLSADVSIWVPTQQQSAVYESRAVLDADGRSPDHHRLRLEAVHAQLAQGLTEQEEGGWDSLLNLFVGCFEGRLDS